MAGITEKERTLYETAWSVSAYADHSPGEQMLPVFLDMLGPDPRPSWHAASVLDAGCGAGKGALALAAAGFSVTCCDITRTGLLPEAASFPFHEAVLWSDLRPVVGFKDYVYCCDVLEHIPQALTMLVISRLLEVSRKGVFLSISLVPDVFGAWVGQPLHQTVQPFTWWRDLLGEMGRVRESRDLLVNGCYFVEPRC